MLLSRTKREGFTILELTVVLLVIAVVMGAAISLISAGLTNLAYKDTKARLKIIQQALLDYRIAYNNLPCPASYGDYTTSQQNFGIAATGADCHGGTPTSDDDDNDYAIGMLPVRSMGLPDEMAFDGWGRRIRYAVATIYTEENAFDTYPLDHDDDSLTIDDFDGTEITTTAAYVVISYGENGHGGRGGTTGTLVSSGSTSDEEHLNCKCDQNGAFDDGVNKFTFIQNDVKLDPANALKRFDDVLVYAKRSALRDADD